jgi:hypothetical protein
LTRKTTGTFATEESIVKNWREQTKFLPRNPKETDSRAKKERMKRKT